MLNVAPNSLRLTQRVSSNELIGYFKMRVSTNFFLGYSHLTLLKVGKFEEI